MTLQWDPAKMKPLKINTAKKPWRPSYLGKPSDAPGQPLPSLHLLHHQIQRGQDHQLHFFLLLRILRQKAMRYVQPKRRMQCVCTSGPDSGISWHMEHFQLVRRFSYPPLREQICNYQLEHCWSTDDNLLINLISIAPQQGFEDPRKKEK